MSDNEEESILSQDEINDLLGSIGGDDIPDLQDDAVDAEEEDAPRISIYDFRRPDFLSRNDAAVITTLGATVADRLADLIPGLGVASLDILTVDEFVRSVGSPCLAVPFAFDTRRRAILELSPTITRQVVSTALSIDAASAGDDREVSALEVAVAARAVADRVVGAFSPLNTTPEAPITQPAAVRATGIGPMVCVLSFSTESTGATGGIASLLLDRFTVETLLVRKVDAPIAAESEARHPNLVLREVLQFNLPGITGADLIAALESRKITVPSSLSGTVTYRGE